MGVYKIIYEILHVLMWLSIPFRDKIPVFFKYRIRLPSLSPLLREKFCRFFSNVSSVTSICFIYHFAISSLHS
jgi:hypothetical protein